MRVQLFSILREHLPPGSEQGQTTLTLPGDATIADLIAHLGIERRVRLIVVNGAQEADRHRRLHDGDQVKLFPSMVGG